MLENLEVKFKGSNKLKDALYDTFASLPQNSALKQAKIKRVKFRKMQEKEVFMNKTRKFLSQMSATNNRFRKREAKRPATNTDAGQMNNGFDQLVREQREAIQSLNSQNLRA